ncbi:MAG: tetratricopeptide repeat protein, partial [Candidatus Heimdallarchaeota archaeon]|nr:tetratricopeptide repeat protein [Candidatus Heimdallarchaeota archaeon]
KSSCLRHLDKHNEAVEVHDILLSLNPKDIDYLFMKGLVLIEASRFEEALEYFDTILKIDPKHRDALFNKGLALRKLGKEAEAKDTMKKALK